MVKDDSKTRSAKPGWLLKTIEGVIQSSIARGRYTKQEVIIILEDLIKGLKKNRKTNQG